MDKKITQIFRKEKGQIVVQGEVNLTDDKGNRIDLNGVDWSFSMKSKNLYQY